jgi:hypothetical protein
MSKSQLVNHAFDDLAHSLRVLLEADYKAKSGGLLSVDRDEAVGNIENALTSVLNAFHSLFDALSKNPESGTIAWYDQPTLAIILIIRNARHHNKANRIRTLYTYHARQARRPTDMRMYVLVNFLAADPTARTFEVYLSWADLRTLLMMPERESRVPAKTRKLVEQYLGCDNFKAYAEYYHQPESRVFFNVVPLIVNAGITIVTSTKKFLKPLSTEGETFTWLFDEIACAKVEEPDVNCGPFALPA